MDNVVSQVNSAIEQIDSELKTQQGKDNLEFLIQTINVLANSLQASPVDTLCANGDYKTITAHKPVILRVPNTFKINAPLIPNLLVAKNCFLNGLPIPDVTDFSINFNNLDDNTNQIGIVIKGTCDAPFTNNNGVYIFELFTSAKTSEPLYRLVDDKPWIEFYLTSFRVAIPKNLDKNSIVKYLIEELNK